MSLTPPQPIIIDAQAAVPPEGLVLRRLDAHHYLITEAGLHLFLQSPDIITATVPSGTDSKLVGSTTAVPSRAYAYRSQLGHWYEFSHQNGQLTIRPY